MPLTESEIAFLQNAATAAPQNSYSPYSRFRVGCAILLDENPLSSPEAGRTTVSLSANVAAIADSQSDGVD